MVAGEGRRRAARAMQMKLRCISRHKSNGAGDYLCWFSPEGRVDYFGETKGGRAHGWGLAEYQDGSWCLRCTNAITTSVDPLFHVSDSILRFVVGFRPNGRAWGGAGYVSGSVTGYFRCENPASC